MHSDKEKRSSSAHTPPPSGYVAPKAFIDNRQSTLWQRRLQHGASQFTPKRLGGRTGAALKLTCFAMVGLNMAYPLFTNTGPYDSVLSEHQPDGNRGDIDATSRGVDTQYSRKVRPMNRMLHRYDVGITDQGRDEIDTNLQQSPDTFLSVSHWNEVPTFYRESQRQAELGNTKAKWVARSGAVLNAVASVSSVGTGIFEYAKRRWNQPK